MDERSAFVGRELLRAFAEGGDLEAGLARLNGALSPGPGRQALERLRRDLDFVAGVRHAGDGERDWLRVALRTGQLIRANGGDARKDVWLEIERQYTSSRALSTSLSQGLIQTLVVSALAAVIALLVTIVYVVFVLPQFHATFGSLGAELPGFTRLVLGSGGALVIGALIVIALILVGFPMSRSLLSDWRGGWRLDLFAWRAFFGRDVARNFRQLLFVAYASGLLRGGLSDSLSLSLASQEAEIYGDVDFQQTGAATAGRDPLVEALLTASKLGHLRQELEAQSQVRLALLDASAERMQLLAAFVVRSLLYLLVGSLVVAMYLPIFMLGAAI